MSMPLALKKGKPEMVIKTTNTTNEYLSRYRAEKARTHFERSQRLNQIQQKQ